MATLWRKTMLYLGLGPDSEYDDYDPGYDDVAPAQSRPSVITAHQPEPEPTGVGTLRPMSGRPNDRGEHSGTDFASQLANSPGGSGGGSGIGSGIGGGGIGAVTPASGGSGGARPRPKVVRPLPVDVTARPRVLSPKSFNQAQILADTFKGGQPVVMNLRKADREVSRRLIDFSSGLCYGLGGKMEKIDNQVYLVSPAHVEVTDEERDRLRDRDYED